VTALDVESARRRFWADGPGAAAGAVFGEFHRRNPDAGCSLALVDAAGVVRVRRDGDRAMAEVLDAVRFVPGYRYDERAMGTTAAAIALHTGSDARVDGAEHLHADLTWLSDAAALVPDGAVVVVLTHVTAPHLGQRP
jgi:transcriptional regulator of acetoin/glycerol metabolism